MRMGFLSLIIALVLILIMPVLFAHAMEGALLKLQIDSRTATWLVIGIFLGSLVNIPVRRIERTALVPVDPLAVYGLGGVWSRTERTRSVTIVAVNVGGCVIPAGLAAYEAAKLLTGAGPVGRLMVVLLLNVFVCYRLARPVKGVGIALPGLMPPLVAALAALVLTPAHATPVAFIAGTLGPLIGADLLHLRQVERMETGVVSIGGAGTFDGILLSGIVALYLA